VDHGVDDGALVKIQLYNGSPGTVHLIAGSPDISWAAGRSQQ